MTETTKIESGIALSDSFNTSPMTIHGVAIGEDETTNHLNGDKFWPAEALAQSTDSLVGVQLTKNHEHDKVEGVIGEVTKATYRDGVGILFEAEVYEEPVAHKIEQGLLEVSIHASHIVSGTTEAGAQIVEDIEFQDLSVVPRGAAESNEVSTGSLEVAALSKELDAEFETSYDEKDGNPWELYFDEEDALDRAEEMGCDREAHPHTVDDEIEMWMPCSSHEDFEDAKRRMDESDDESDDSVEEQEQESVSTEDSDAEDEDKSDSKMTEEEEIDETEEVSEEFEELQAERDALLEEVMDVRSEYAEALSKDSAFETEELAEKFTVGELAEKYEESDVELAASPAPRGEDVEETELADEETDDDVSDEEVSMLETKKERFTSLGMDGAAQSVERRLAELKDE